MNRIRFLERTFLFVCAIATGALLGGCAGPTSKTSKYMGASLTAPASPPAGKTLVCIHRPKSFFGAKLYTKIWDGTKFIADLGNGHSVAYVCEPGQHYFMNTSAQAEGCVEAQLLPDQTYDLWTDTITATFIVSFKLKPIHQDDQTRKQVAEWTKRNRWVEAASPTIVFKQATQDDIQKLLEELASENASTNSSILLQMTIVEMTIWFNEPTWLR